MPPVGVGSPAGSVTVAVKVSGWPKFRVAALAVTFVLVGVPPAARGTKSLTTLVAIGFPLPVTGS